MRRLARGATFLALATGLRAEAALDGARTIPLGVAVVIALGRTAFATGQHGDAPAHDHMEYVLAPDLPGFLRELGSTYDKIGAAAPQREFYRRYLEQRPSGANAGIRTEQRMGRAWCRAW